MIHRWPSRPVLVADENEADPHGGGELGVAAHIAHHDRTRQVGLADQ
jgi:hypothetical protein